MRIPEVARRYAKAIYDLAKESNQEEHVLSELNALCKLFAEDKTIYDFIHTPLIRDWEKSEALKKALENKGLSKLIYHYVLLLAEKNRLDIFCEVVEAYKERRDHEKGITRGKIISAAPLSSDEQLKVQESINQATKKKVILTYEVDTKIIGGMVAQVGSLSFNDSLDSHLRRLNEDIKRRAH